jgi:hypothetical protein
MPFFKAQRDLIMESSRRCMFLMIAVCKGAPPRIQTALQVVSSLNTAATLDCVVDSQLSYNVTWSRALQKATREPETGKYGRWIQV